jgi:hypothetical protein
MRVVRDWSDPRQPLSRSRTPWPLRARVDATGVRVDATDAGVMRTHAPVSEAGAPAAFSGGPVAMTWAPAGFAGVPVMASGRPVSPAHVPAIMTRGCGGCTGARAIDTGARVTGAGAAVMPTRAGPVGWVERSDIHHARFDGYRLRLNPSYKCRAGRVLTRLSRAWREPAGRNPPYDSSVGWVERSDTHHARSMGIAFGSTHPTGALQGGFLTRLSCEWRARKPAG